MKSDNYTLGWVDRRDKIDRHSVLVAYVRTIRACCVLFSILTYVAISSQKVFDAFVQRTESHGQHEKWGLPYMASGGFFYETVWNHQQLSWRGTNLTALKFFSFKTPIQLNASKKKFKLNIRDLNGRRLKPNAKVRLFASETRAV